MKPTLALALVVAACSVLSARPALAGKNQGKQQPPKLEVELTSSLDFRIVSNTTPGTCRSPQGHDLILRQVGARFEASVVAGACTGECEGAWDALVAGSAICDGVMVPLHASSPASSTTVSPPMGGHPRVFVPMGFPVDDLDFEPGKCALQGDGGKSSTCKVEVEYGWGDWKALVFRPETSAPLPTTAASVTFAIKGKTKKGESPTLYTIRVRLDDKCRPVVAGALPGLLPGARTQTLLVNALCDTRNESFGGPIRLTSDDGRVVIHGTIRCEKEESCLLALDAVPADPPDGMWSVTSAGRTLFSVELRKLAAPRITAGRIRSTIPGFNGKMSEVARPDEPCKTGTSAPEPATSLIATVGPSEAAVVWNEVAVDLTEGAPRWVACSNGQVIVRGRPARLKDDDAASCVDVDAAGLVSYTVAGEADGALSAELRAVDLAGETTFAITPLTVAARSLPESIPFPIRERMHLVCDGDDDDDGAGIGNGGRLAAKHKSDCEFRVRIHDGLTREAATAYGMQRLVVTAIPDGTTEKGTSASIIFDPTELCDPPKGKPATKYCTATVKMRMPLALASDDADLVYSVAPEAGDGIVYRQAHGMAHAQRFEGTIRARGAFSLPLPIRTYFTIPVNLVTVTWPARSTDLTGSHENSSTSFSTFATGVELIIEKWNYADRAGWPIRGVAGLLFADKEGVHKPSAILGGSLTQAILGGTDTTSISGSVALFWQHDFQDGGDHIMLGLSLDVLKIAPLE